MREDYERHTRDHYQSEKIAQTYHDQFANNRGLKSIRSRLVANGEKKIIRRLLQSVPHDNVLDIPAGTGKLAPIFKNLGSRVLSCDISADMLSIAQQEYQRIQYTNVDFQICDATQLESLRAQKFDVAVCLRLLHRVPPAIRIAILSGLAKVADNVIVSLGISSPYHSMRRSVRQFVIGGDTRPIWFSKLDEFTDSIRPHYTLMAKSNVLPLLSQEIVLLLRSKTNTKKGIQ